MKNIWMLFAAVVLFAACDDNLGDDQQGAQGGVQDSDPVIVNVSATSALGYQWQSGDNVRVVFNEETSKEFAVVPGTDATVASFSYNIEEVKDVVLNDYVYVVAPGAVEAELKDVTVGASVEEKLQMTYSLPATQDGVISSDENLSYAVLSAESLESGQTVSTHFKSPFAVLDVTLPEGVSSVVFTADNMYGSPLAGDATILVGSDEVSTITVKNSSKVVTLANPTGLPTRAKLLVLPGNAKPLAVKMEGIDDSMYETSVLAETTLKAGEVYPVNLAGDDIFSINYSIDGGEAAKLGQTVAVSPLGGDLAVSIVSLHTGQVTVTENADWIMVVDQTPVRSFHSDMVQLQVDGNMTTQERQAEVTVNYGEGQSKTFTVTQGVIDMSIVNDAEGNQIVWEESFGIFNNVDLSGEPLSSVTNKFTISLSDDFSKGAYLVSNMFKSALYYDENNQMQTNKGADYYADMEGDVLVVHKRAGGNSYSFSGDIRLNYNKANQTFTASPVALSDGKYIGNYTVKVFVEQPAQGGSAGIAGIWNQTVAGMSWPTPSATMTIAVNGTSVTINDFISAGTEVTGTLDGNTITIPAGAMVESAGPLDAAVILTISADAKSISAPEFSIGGWINVASYSATKQ